MMFLLYLGRPPRLPRLISRSARGTAEESPFFPAPTLLCVSATVRSLTWTPHCACVRAQTRHSSTCTHTMVIWVMDYTHSSARSRDLFRGTRACATHQHRFYTKDTASHGKLQATKLYVVNKSFGIDWINSIMWMDVTKPLYSGIAAWFYLGNVAEPIPLTKLRTGNCITTEVVMDRTEFYRSSYSWWTSLWLVVTYDKQETISNSFAEIDFCRSKLPIISRILLFCDRKKTCMCWICQVERSKVNYSVWGLS